MKSIKFLFLQFFLCFIFTFGQTNFRYYKDQIANNNELSEQIKIVASVNYNELSSLDSVISKTRALFLNQNSVSKDSAFIVFWNYYHSFKDNYNNQIAQIGLPKSYSAFVNIADYPSKKSEQRLNKSGFEFTESELTFLKKLNRFGFKLTSQEGMFEITFGNKRIIEDNFRDLISKELYLFASKYLDESITPFAYDGALSISLNEVTKRLIVWERISRLQLPIYLIEQANEIYKKYLKAITAGIDNSPAFNFTTKRLNKNFENALNDIAKNYKGTNSAVKISQYLELLKKNKMKKTQEVEIFINNL